jgi:hypothetical protein
MRDVTVSPQRVSSSTDAAMHTVMSARPGSPSHMAGVVQKVLSVACSSACRHTARLCACYTQGRELSIAPLSEASKSLRASETAAVCAGEALKL